METDKNISYKDAITRLEKIVNNLQSDNCDIDTVVQQAREAANLIKICRERLTTTEAELKSVLEQLRAE